MFNDQGHNYLVYIAKDKKTTKQTRKRKKGKIRLHILYGYINDIKKIVTTYVHKNKTTFNHMFFRNFF